MLGQMLKGALFWFILGLTELVLLLVSIILMMLVGVCNFLSETERQQLVDDLPFLDPILKPCGLSEGWLIAVVAVTSLGFFAAAVVLLIYAASRLSR